MIDENTIRQKLDNFVFQSYTKVVARLLSTFGILDTTIAKINSKIEAGESGPFYVYRRAIIYCTEDMTSAEEYSSAKKTMPLLIVFTPSQIIITNEYLGSVICDYNEITNYIHYLAPLHSWDVNRNDHYSTLELDSLVESLYRELILNDNDERDARIFIFSLLYMAHFSTLLELSQVSDSLKGYNSSGKEKLAKVFDLFFAWDCPYITDNTRCLLLSSDAYKYIFAILQFDTNLIDAEFLTSLIYKMTGRDEAGLYGHQTSFINVEKLLQPLFLKEMQQKANSSTNENFFQVVTEIYNTTIFDPTNGPGCYLVSSYNGLLQQLRDVEAKFSINCQEPLNISHFIGLVSNELTQELTRLALTFVHSSELKRLGLLNIETIKKTYNQLAVYIGDELEEAWETYVAPSDFLYIVGSPDFKGNNKIHASIKKSMQRIFASKQLNSADLCSAWLMKTAKFIRGTHAKSAFVLTNSVSQGTQATFILDKINDAGCEYIFAHRSFKWKTSNDNSGVTVVIIGIAMKGLVKNKFLYDGGKEYPCQEIGANLLPDIDIRVKSRTTPLSQLLPHMCKGNMPDGATHLTFTSAELDVFLEMYPDASKYIKSLYGGEEFVKGRPKWVLWITDKDLNDALQIKGIADRIEKVRQQRNSPKSTSSEKSKANPHKFREDRTTSKGKVSLIVPCVTSENRQYFQMGILGSNAIVNNNVSVVFDCDIWLLALLESRMHEVWAKNACGGHETRPRYSSSLCYNTFPVPELNNKQICALRNLSKTLLEVREKYCDKSLADIYQNMPPELIRIHHLIDETVDSYYRNQPFTSDGERLIWLRNMYNTLIKMNNLFETTYDRNGSSVTTNNLGMREMQLRAYEKYASQYLLLKAPPASGKSRALMFIAIEKLKQGLVKKVIVAVPERSIGKSFGSTRLMDNGFHTDWVINQKYDLCSPGGEPMKTKTFSTFMEDRDAKILLCTHSTLRFAYEKIGYSKFNDCLLAIDEFHHVSAEADSKLGELLRAIMAETNAHILAMTGSYFRGDCVAVLSPSDERKFEKVTYNYYEQLNGYQYLKSLGIGFHFYNGVYYEALKDSEVLDLSKKTIIYIPNVNSAESTGEKIMEVDQILGCIGTYMFTDDCGIYHVRTNNGRELRIADLVNDTDYEQRERIMSYLRAIQKPEDMDIIIALGMAKEGFDWPFCETTLTIGYRGSLTEIVQIIGRCTRDSKNKSHAQFTNLVAEPSANREEIVESVNNILKAISASLLMEEVIAPKYNFKPKDLIGKQDENGEASSKKEDGSSHTIFIDGFRGIRSNKIQDIIDNDLVDLKARILQNPDVQHAIGQNVPAETINNGLIPKVIREVIPDLNEEESKELGTYIVIDSVLSHRNIKDINGQKFLEFANRLINVNEINIDLIYSVNPFHDAYEVLSKSLDSRVFRSIQAYIKSMRIDVTDDEAKVLWPKVTEFAQKMQREPNLDSNDPYERRLAEVLLYAKRRIMEKNG